MNQRVILSFRYGGQRFQTPLQWRGRRRRFANSSCPVRTHIDSFAFNNLRHSHLPRNSLICSLECTESAPKRNFQNRRQKRNLACARIINASHARRYHAIQRVSPEHCIGASAEYLAVHFLYGFMQLLGRFLVEMKCTGSHRDVPNHREHTGEFRSVELPR